MQNDTPSPLSNPNPEPTNPVSSSEPNLSVSMPPPAPPKKRKTTLILVIILILSLAGGAAYWFMRPQEESAEIQNQQVVKTPITTETGKFYSIKTRDTLNIYDPVTKKTEAVKIDLGGDRQTIAMAIGQNQPMTFSADGKKILVPTETYEDGHMGPGEGDVIARELIIIENQKPTKLLDLNVDRNISFTDVVLSPDGKTAYLLLTEAKEGTDLYSLDISSKKTTLLKDDVVALTNDKTPIYVDDEGVMHLYSQTDARVIQHEVKGGKYTTKNIGKAPCECSFENPQALSPDGKNLLFENIKDGEKGGFTYYLMSTENGKSAELGAPPADDQQWVSMLWKPDSKQVAFDVAGFNDDTKYKPRAELLVIASKQHSGFVSSGSKDDHILVLAWSHDGRLLALMQKDKVVFYDTNNKELVETDIDLKDMDSSTSYGWLH